MYRLTGGPQVPRAHGQRINGRSPRCYSAPANRNAQEEKRRGKLWPTETREVAIVEGSCIGQPYTHLLVLNV
jgi:hypothetical protein